MVKKKIVQDVLPPERRSIRNIPLPGTKTKKREVEEVEEKPTPGSRRTPSKTSQKKGNYTRVSIWSVAVICLVGLAYALSFFFVRATVTVTPKQQTISLNTTISAQKDAGANALSYTTISVSKEGSKEVAASGEVQVDERASGDIIIYNNYSSAPQTLIANTRFETPDGLIFRIREQVRVPGFTKTNTIVMPGFVKAKVYADQPGEKYNVGLADFTIPGFKGDPRYQGFTAKSDPNSRITGGFSGLMNKVSDADKSQAKIEIEQALRGELLDLARAQIPSTHILFEEAAQISFEQLAQASGANNSAIIKEKGNLSAVIFDKAELAQFLTKNSIIETDSFNSYYIQNLEEMDFKFVNKTDFFSQKTDSPTISFSGDAQVVWNTSGRNMDGFTLEEELAGRKRSEIKDILSKFTSIERAEIVITPFWSMSFPDSPERIRIVLSGQK